MANEWLSCCGIAEEECFCTLCSFWDVDTSISSTWRSRDAHDALDLKDRHSPDDNTESEGCDDELLKIADPKEQ